MASKQAYFITGTDTGVGKTHVACKLLREYAAKGLKVVGMKPVAAGCELIDGEWCNEDVEKLIAASNIQAPRELVNPYCFTPPIAPHIAAEQAGVVIDVSRIKKAYNALTELADVVIVEGAGGFLVPLNAEKTMADLAEALNIPVILVVGLKLGCINHTLLSVQAIQAKPLVFHGWIANHLEPQMTVVNDNLAFIAKKLKINSLTACDFDVSDK